MSDVTVWLNALLRAAERSEPVAIECGKAVLHACENASFDVPGARARNMKLLALLFEHHAPSNAVTAAFKKELGARMSCLGQLRPN